MPPRWRIFTDESVHGFAKQIGVSGVSPELLDQVADEAPQTEMATIGPGQVDLLVQAAMGQSGVKRRCGPLDSVIPMFVELLGGVGGGRVEVPVGVGGPVRSGPRVPITPRRADRPVGGSATSSWSFRSGTRTGNVSVAL